MKESFFDDINDEFPVNSQVRCGQSAFRLGFAHMTLDDTETPVSARLPERSERRRFLPGGMRKR